MADKDPVCTCPHGDAKEPWHDGDCPAVPVFDRQKAHELLLTAARLDPSGTDPALTKLISELSYQLVAASRIIDKVPVDVLSTVIMRKVEHKPPSKEFSITKFLNQKLPCGCHCAGGCGDPYAACMWPCAEHIPF